MNKKAALYLRVSTDLQNNGLESQQKSLESYCQVKGICNYEIYSDFAVSGAKATRPNLDRMLADCKAGLVESVIVYSFSRFARSTKHLILALESFQQQKINFISVTENLDLSTPLGRTVFQIIAAIGELERELIRERVRNGIANARSKGKQIGATKKFTNCESFVQLSNKGFTVREIAKALNCSTATVVRTLKSTIHKAA